MNILDAVLQANGGQAVRQAGEQLGLSEGQTTSALGALIPALVAGMGRNTSQQGGLDSLLGALMTGGHQRYVDSPDALLGGGAVDEGNGILGHILGSKDVSRQVASRASAQTGLSEGLLKQMLPIAATLMMGVLSQRSGMSAQGFQPGQPPQNAGSNVLGMLTPLLDRNRDGSPVDEMIGLVGQLLSRQ